MSNNYIHPTGYSCITITFNGKRGLYREHRLIYLLHKGCISKYLDHINGIRHDNRIENLREATSSLNAVNAKMKSNNTSGYKGVHWLERTKSWKVAIRFEGKQHHIGYFKSKRKAAEAYNKVALKHHGEFAKLNEIKEVDNEL